jgi:hypothetical protein
MGILLVVFTVLFLVTLVLIDSKRQSELNELRQELKRIQVPLK